MAINTFKIKKWAGLILTGFFPSICFFIGLKFYGFWVALIVLLVSIVAGVMLGNLFLKNPFSEMLEGKGLLVFNIDSTGIIRPFICGLTQPYIKGNLGKDDINDVYDRSAVLQLTHPKKAGNATELKEGGLNIHITEDEFNKSRFGLFQYPVLLYNNQIKSLITKDFLSEMEKKTFAEHGILYLNRKMEELTGVLRDFGRYVVELTKPKSSIFQNKYFWIVVVVFIVILIILFAKPIITQLAGAGGAISSSLGSTKAVVPR